jgi:hypothetical protein
MLLNKRLSKAFFLKNFELSVAEKKVLNNSIQNMEWLASIKPLNSNIREFKNETHIYEEVQMMVCTIYDNQLNEVVDKCISIFQKYIPYPIVLFVVDDTNFIMNTCDKRINQNDKSLRTIEKLISTSPISNLYENEVTAMFFDALDFSKLDKSNMESLYQGYMQAVVQFQTAVFIGTYIKRTTARTKEDLLLLFKIENIERDIVQLTNQLKKETQLNSKVALNITIQTKRKEIQEIKNTLATL